ncbi:MAG: hypothetical protein Q8P18_07165 [Pseudomonadota bacterium]|nr:hypothetical protein [Pseudomonadota bacterium]
MANDPYGFPDAVAGSSAPTDAAICLWTGVAALICGALGPCLCYTPWFVAFPLSIVSIYYGVEAKSGGPIAPGFDTASTAGLVAAGVSLALSLLYIGIFVIYVGIFAFAAVAGNL